MTTTAPQSKTEAPSEKTKRAKGPQMKSSSHHAKLLATAILEVLGGLRLPTEAAKALNISQARYYQLESRALNGFLSACEPVPKGRVVSAASELLQAQKEVQRLQKECARYAALVRLAQRTVGLARPEPPKAAQKGSGTHRRRKPTVRALKAAELLQSRVSGEAEATVAGEQPAKE
jgi:hypothetical protein